MCCPCCEEELKPPGDGKRFTHGACRCGLEVGFFGGDVWFRAKDARHVVDSMDVAAKKRKELPDDGEDPSTRRFKLIDWD
jgi:hypothetical protein